MPFAPPRRLSFAAAALLGIAWWTASPAPVVAAPAPVAMAPVLMAPVARVQAAGVQAVDGGEADAGSDAPAPRASPRDRKKRITETAWHLFFVTAGGLFALVVIVWGFGWYKRTFLEEDPLQAELFDAATRAEIERHRKETQAAREAAKQAADAETTGAEQETVSAPPADLSAALSAAPPAEPVADLSADPVEPRDADGV